MHFLIRMKGSFFVLLLEIHGHWSVLCSLADYLSIMKMPGLLVCVKINQAQSLRPPHRLPIQIYVSSPHLIRSVRIKLSVRVFGTGKCSLFDFLYFGENAWLHVIYASSPIVAGLGVILRDHVRALRTYRASTSLKYDSNFEPVQVVFFDLPCQFL